MQNQRLHNIKPSPPSGFRQRPMARSTIFLRSPIWSFHQRNPEQQQEKAG